MPKHNEGRWKKATYSVEDKNHERRHIVVAGRARWALECLLSAGETGCTPITTPGPRWSHYTWLLRHEHGLDIETKTEKHGGPFSGHHARYILRSNVTPVAAEEMAA